MWLIIFIVLIVVLEGFIVYDKVLNKEQKDVPIKEIEKDDVRMVFEYNLDSKYIDTLLK